MKQSSTPESIKNREERDLWDQKSVPGRERQDEAGQEECPQALLHALATGGDDVTRLPTEQASPGDQPSLPLPMKAGSTQLHRLFTGGLGWP